MARTDDKLLHDSMCIRVVTNCGPIMVSATNLIQPVWAMGYGNATLTPGRLSAQIGR
eukprot:CAMPEP_0198683566 /NCGR_PEP_ID=MMETSP1468-20131203/10846_1 /TAXON_ID=1461545 /ORGANISM="Mantoniella sp, Strain CCMP1436" /LENGTH=56 /DNA_ID=CAMNT_0044427685 /DNA_START=234 /DNA_END=401 /DNA_ORIENTATION=-